MNMSANQIQEDDIELQELVVEHKASHKPANSLQRKGFSYSTFSTLLAIVGVSVLGSLGLYGNGDATEYSLKLAGGPLAANQITNFRNGNGVLLNLHITHHGGTSVCTEMNHNLTSPSFACLSARKDDVGDDYPHYFPWTYDETANNLAIVHEYCQFISWEFSKPKRNVRIWLGPLLLV